MSDEKKPSSLKQTHQLTLFQSMPVPPNRKLASFFSKKEAKEAAVVAVIGAAGRGADGPKMTKALFEKMTETALSVIRTEFQLDPSHVSLVSGGAAWADHVAVRLYLSGIDSSDTKTMPSFQGLSVFLPCKMVGAKDRWTADATRDDGRRMNELHGAFSRKMGYHTMSDLAAAEALGATVDVSSFSFRERNAKVVEKAQYVIALTWGPGNEPKEGGTKMTWNMCSKFAVKRHISLDDLH